MATLIAGDDYAAEREAEAAQQQAARQGKVAGQVESVFAEVDRLEGEQKWPEALAASAARDQARGATSVGPHRDDLRLGLGGCA